MLESPDLRGTRVTFSPPGFLGNVLRATISLPLMAFILALMLAGCETPWPMGDLAQANAGQQPASAVTDRGPRAIVLGEEIRIADDRELQATILARLFARYRSDHGIEVHADEIEAFIAKMSRVREQDRRDRDTRLQEIERRLESAGLTTAERDALRAERADLVKLAQTLSNTGEEKLTPDEAAQVKTMRSEMASSFVLHWKVNRALYRSYGGRIIYQQGGPEPLDAYRRFLEDREREGAFRIHDQKAATEFWRYFRDESMHSFMKPGSADEARAFETPPWE